MDLTYAINLEKVVLSSIIFNHDEIYTVLEILEPDDFYLKAHQDIYKIMIELHKEDMPIDEDFIKKRGVGLPSITDNFFLDILTARPITNSKAYCLEIKESSKLRKIENISKSISQYLYEQSKSDDILLVVQKEIEEIENKGLINPIDTKNLINIVLKDMQTASENGSQVIGQTSGLKELDRIIGAFEDGDLVVISARPSMGKTSIISSLTIQSLFDKRGVLVESLEMPSKKIMVRLLAAHSGESLSDLKRGLVKNKDKFNESIEFFKNAELIIHDKSYPTLIELESRIKSTLRKNPNIKNVFVDHTGKVQLLGKTREDIEIGQISASLKKIARDFNIRVFLLQQLNRSLESRENKRPILSDLKNSGNIEEDADIVLGLYRDSYYNKKKKEDIYSIPRKEEDAEIIILKNRDGRVGTARVSFEGASARFINQEETPLVVEFE